MSIPYIALSAGYALGCVVLIAIILLQKKRSAGLGSIAGMGGGSGTYWDKNKGRSMEGTLEKYSKIGGFIFFALSIGLCVLK